MAKKNSYREYLKQEFAELIDQLELPDLQKRFMKSRWLDQLLWFEGKAESARKWSNRLRLATIVGGVLIPPLVSLNYNDNQFRKDIFWLAFGISQVVAVSASVEEYFHFGDKHTQYRKTAECLKSEAWEFFQLSGYYQECSDHRQGYTTFAFRVENFLQEDLHVITELVKQNTNQEKQQQENQGQNTSSSPRTVSESKAPKNLSSTNNANGESRKEALPHRDEKPLKLTSGDGKTTN